MPSQHPSFTSCLPSRASSACPALPLTHHLLQGPYELTQEQQELEGGAAPHWRRRRVATGARAFEGLRCHVATTLDAPFKRADIA